MSKRRKKSAAAAPMTFDERVAAVAEQPTYAKSNSLFVHPVRTNRSDRIVGHFPSRLMEASLPFHSRLERVLLNVCDLTVGTDKFFPQSERFAFSDGEKVRHYTPDCGVEACKRRVMVESKYDDDAFDPANVRTRELASPFMKRLGWELLLLTEKVLLHDDLLANILTIRRRFMHPYDLRIVDQVHDALLRNDGSMTFQACAEVATSAGADANLIYAAIGRRELYCNLWERLSDASNIIHPSLAPMPFFFDLLEAE